MAFHAIIEMRFARCGRGWLARSNSSDAFCERRGGADACGVRCEGLSSPRISDCVYSRFTLCLEAVDGEVHVGQAYEALGGEDGE